MRIIFYIIRKEFIQIFRNRSMLPIIFLVPLVQLIILVNAATLEMKHIRLYVVDNDLSETSRKLIGKYEGSPFYIINNYSFSIDDAKRQLNKGNIDAIINIPADFERNLVRDNKASVQVIVNAINGVVAGITSAYIQNITAGFNQEVITDFVGIPQSLSKPGSINIIGSYWFNPQLNYKNFMVPGVLVILVTIIGLMLSGLNLVREKELGTIEQINVTPIKKYQFVAGKLIPFWILALVELAIGLTLGKLLYDIPILGSLPLLFFVASIYLLVVLGGGLLISTRASTQQQAMFLTFFFIIIFVLMSGIFTSVESMPKWGQYLDRINPIYYFMRIVRMILLKGSGLMDILPELGSLTVLAFLMLTLAVRQYRKTA